MVLEVLVVELLVRAAILLLGLLVIGLRREHDAQVMLGMLEIAFRHDDVAGRLGIPAELQIFVCNGLGGAPDLHVGPVALIHPAQRVPLHRRRRRPRRLRCDGGFGYGSCEWVSSKFHFPDLIEGCRQVPSGTAGRAPRRPVFKSAQKDERSQVLPVG